MGFTEFSESALGEPFGLVVHAFPDVEQGKEVGFAVNKAFVGGASEFFFSERAFSRILYR